MSNRIEKKFRELKKRNQKAFIAFVTAGDPNLKTTPHVVQSLESSGVDIVELGMPFSDPMADGPVIQKSSERALRSGTTLKGILKTVQKIRQTSQIPILLMGYFNPVYQYGVEKFFQDAHQAGVDGTLLVDLPPEEGEGVRRAAHRAGISLVFLLAPTSDGERIRTVTRKGSGFLYYVSLTGVTGAKLRDRRSSEATLAMIQQESRVPVCVGFGIKTLGDARRVARLADGVVVGSALVELFGRYSPSQALSRVRRLAGGLAKAVHSS